METNNSRLENLNQRTLLALWWDDPGLTRLRVDWPQFGHNVDWTAEGNSIAANRRVNYFAVRGFVGPMIDSAKAFWTGLSRNRSIECLAICECDLVEEILTLLRAFFRDNRNLCGLVVSKCWGLNADVCATIGEVVANPASPLYSLEISSNDISDQGVVVLTDALSNNTALNKLDFSGNRSAISIVGWKAFFSLLQNSNLGVEHLNLSWNGINDGGAIVLGDGLANNSTLNTLKLSNSRSISPGGWRNFSNALHDKNTESALTVLDLGYNSIDDMCATQLADSLAKLKSLKTLSLRCNNSIRTPGWIAFSNILRISKLEELDVRHNNIDDNVMIAFADALGGNGTLRKLTISDRPRRVAEADAITARGWEALSGCLCDASSVNATFYSNHTLEQLYTWPDREVLLLDRRGVSCDVAFNPLLRMNANDDKFGVARLKILRYHFRNEDHGTRIQDFVEMGPGASPLVMAWLGKDIRGLSLLYQFLRSMRALFESNENSKASGSKRKLIN